MNELEAFRKEKDDFFGHDHQSPLTREQKREFKGLDYFPENPILRLEVKAEELPNKERIEMQTSTGDVQIYFRHSQFHFRVDGAEFRVNDLRGTERILFAVCRFAGWEGNLSSRPLSRTGIFARRKFPD